MTGSNRASSDTLLSHLAWRMASLSSHREDIAVEALGYILDSNPARQALEGLVAQNCADVGRITRVKTQVVGEGRPDLVGFDHEGRERLLIEAKFWARLTDNQPNADLERSRSVVMFVAPASRIEPLWADLILRASVDRSRCSIDDFQLKSVTTDGKKCLMLISWGHLLDLLEAADSTCLVEIRQLRGLAEREDDDSGFPPLRSEEMSPDIPRRLRGLRRLLMAVANKLKSTEVANVGGLKSILGDTESIGLYMTIADVEAWVGIHFEAWARGNYPDTPLWIMFSRKGKQQSMEMNRANVALDRLARSDPAECFDDDRRNAVFVPIMLPTGVDYEGLIDSVVRRIHEVAHLMEEVGSSRDPL